MHLLCREKGVHHELTKVPLPKHVQSMAYVGVCGTHYVQTVHQVCCMEQVGDASVEGQCEGNNGMTGAAWRVATAVFTAGDVNTFLL